ncbi:hypothetical protein BD413DRAFT_63002 [Trametes elegans]|nr:hypothetical protein BD413DRAFT_63002 [Trametes elegans]
MPPVDPLPRPDLEPTSFATFPPVPQDAQTGNYYYFLGWNYNNERRERTKAYTTAVFGPQRVSRVKEQNHYSRLLWIDIMRYPHYSIFYDPDRARVVMADKTFPKDKPADRSTDFIVAFSSTHPVNARRTCRPTQAQYDFLVSLFGAEPKWYRDYFEKKAHQGYLRQTTMPWYDCADCGKTHNLRTGARPKQQ